MARLKSTMIMNDTFGTGAQPQVTAKAKPQTRMRKLKTVALAINCNFQNRDMRTQMQGAETEHNLPIGWALLGLSAACAAFWGVVALVVF